MYPFLFVDFALYPFRVINLSFKYSYTPSSMNSLSKSPKLSVVLRNPYTWLNTSPLNLFKKLTTPTRHSIILHKFYFYTEHNSGSTWNALDGEMKTNLTDQWRVWERQKASKQIQYLFWIFKRSSIFIFCIPRMWHNSHNPILPNKCQFCFTREPRTKESTTQETVGWKSYPTVLASPINAPREATETKYQTAKEWEDSVTKSIQLLQFQR